MSEPIMGEGGNIMFILFYFVFFIWTLWFWADVPGLRTLIPVAAGIGVVYSIGLSYYERFEARRKRFK